MGLPVFQHPTFSLTLPSTQQQVSFRPFLVKEEKILLIAQASQDQTEIVRAIKQVINNCIVNKDVNVDDFTTFDLEYFFIKLRAKSVQNIIELQYRDNEDNKVYTVEVDLDTVEVTRPSSVSSIIEVSPTTTITLRYPRLSVIDDVEKLTNAIDFNFMIMQSCIESISDNNVVYKMSDFSQEEIKQYLEDLDIKSYAKIQEFIEAMPRVEHTVGYTNSQGKDVKIVLKTLTDFFTLG